MLEVLRATLQEDIDLGVFPKLQALKDHFVLFREVPLGTTRLLSALSMGRALAQILSQGGLYHEQS